MSVNVFKNLRFLYSISSAEQLKGDFRYGQNQVCFIGRSNVGKSSLINSIVDSKKVSLVSKSPGKTRAINYFITQDNKFLLTDLPGYGYAKRSKEERKRWSMLIDRYIGNQRDRIKIACVLVDARHKLKEIDLQAMNYLDSNAVKFLMILTKIDKINDNELESRIAEITNECSNFEHLYPEIISTSSNKKIGTFDLRTILHEFLIN
ncbi:YihA family ribosome biogenesis GTP-binding protein [Anaplasmataceae bacterium AB001_6]|nr:YihA family ribosome biogenesis GTP-binding protein [Anaplasmataceae bacterium AB001_6]